MIEGIPVLVTYNAAGYGKFQQKERWNDGIWDSYTNVSVSNLMGVITNDGVIRLSDTQKCSEISITDQSSQDDDINEIEKSIEDLINGLKISIDLHDCACDRIAIRDNAIFYKRRDEMIHGKVIYGAYGESILIQFVSSDSYREYETWWYKNKSKFKIKKPLLKPVLFPDFKVIEIESKIVNSRQLELRFD